MFKKLLWFIFHLAENKEEIMLSLLIYYPFLLVTRAVSCLWSSDVMCDVIENKYIIYLNKCHKFASIMFMIGNLFVCILYIRAYTIHKERWPTSREIEDDADTFRYNMMRCYFFFSRTKHLKCIWFLRYNSLSRRFATTSIH